MSSTIGYTDGQTDGLWMLVVYGDKKADKDAAVLSAIHNAAEDVSEEWFDFSQGSKYHKQSAWDQVGPVGSYHDHENFEIIGPGLPDTGTTVCKSLIKMI